MNFWALRSQSKRKKEWEEKKVGFSQKFNTQNRHMAVHKFCQNNLYNFLSFGYEPLYLGMSICLSCLSFPVLTCPVCPNQNL